MGKFEEYCLGRKFEFDRFYVEVFHSIIRFYKRGGFGGECERGYKRRDFGDVGLFGTM